MEAYKNMYQSTHSCPISVSTVGYLQTIINYDLSIEAYRHLARKIAT